MPLLCFQRTFSISDVSNCLLNHGRKNVLVGEHINNHVRSPPFPYFILSNCTAVKVAEVRRISYHITILKAA
jgi:hypothetical protein